MYAYLQNQYMSLENHQDGNQSNEDSQSRHSVGRTKIIKKTPKQQLKESRSNSEYIQPLFAVKPAPEFRVFQSEQQKHQKLIKFWREEIDGYYRKQVGPKEQELLQSILEEQIPTLRQTMQNPFEVYSSNKFPFQELFRYFQIVKHCRQNGKNLVHVQNTERNYLAIFEHQKLQKIIQVSPQQAFLVSKRQSFMSGLQLRQKQYNHRNNKNQSLSQISAEIAFFLYLMKQNKSRIQEQVSCLQQRIHEERPQTLRVNSNVQDRYVTCLIKKNIRIALASLQIDQLNYFGNLDYLQQYGVIEPQHMHIFEHKRQFEDFIKRKKSKKAKKNPKSILKTSCAACLSHHYQQYNPFSHCPQCLLRFHKYCYTLSPQGLCQPCLIKKGSQGKGRGIQCQFCANRGLLSLPTSQMTEGVSIHIFCMLVNGLWKYQKGILEFKPSSQRNENTPDDLCSICNTGVYTYKCEGCQDRVHPLCAYLNGWNMWLDNQDKIHLHCCAPGIDKERQSYRRKFVLNYKKILFKSDRQK